MLTSISLTTTEPIFGNADMAIREVNNSLLAIIPMCRCADRKFTIQNVNFYKYSLCLCGKIGLLKRVVNILHLLRLAQERLEEYSMRAASAKLRGHGLGTLRAEYIHRYNRLLDREKQPHCDFFLNLSLEAEDELNFEEEEPFNLSDYDQYFEWDEAEYMRLRFIAARHYASRGHWDDAYAYVLRTRPENMTEHEDTYSRNAQAWHYTNARINELIQEAEQALEFRNRQTARWSPHQSLEDSLVPPRQTTRTMSSRGGLDQSVQGPQGPSSPTAKKEQRGGESRTPSKTPLSPDRESQSEERKSVIDAVKQITGACEETSVPGGVSIGDTPEYDWDTRYDGIQGFEK